jgi:hypothetical protein
MRGQTPIWLLIGQLREVRPVNIRRVTESTAADRRLVREVASVDVNYRPALFGFNLWFAGYVRTGVPHKNSRDDGRNSLQDLTSPRYRRSIYSFQCSSSCRAGINPSSRHRPLYGMDKRVAVFLSATDRNDSSGDHVSVRQEVADDFFVNLVRTAADRLCD